MKIPCEDLKQLSINLGLDDVNLQEVYDLSEQLHQRVMELWYKKDDQPTWEKLHAAMPSEPSRGQTDSLVGRKSSTSESIRSASPTPMSPDQTSKIIYILHNITSCYYCSYILVMQA